MLVSKLNTINVFHAYGRIVQRDRWIIGYSNVKPSVLSLMEYNTIPVSKDQSVE
jgi:hypothetical protein